MDDCKYNLQFEKLCDALGLGELVEAPHVIQGGLLHRMYALDTTLGRYAVKALNPQIMLRPTAMQNYINSERIANEAAKNMNVVPAKIINESFMHEIDKQYYLVFDWIEGRSLKPCEITEIHCSKMGCSLASIHMTDFSKLGIHNDTSVTTMPTDWNMYMKKGMDNQIPWADLMSETINDLYIWETRANEASKELLDYMLISHRDLDPKNVMWSNSEPVIIDWESAGYVNPMQELTETAVYWSENEAGEIIKERFLAFIDGYLNRCKIYCVNWRPILWSGLSGKLGWLEYNLKRSLCIECTDAGEQLMGTGQVLSTIKAIRYYSCIINELEKWLNSISII